MSQTGKSRCDPGEGEEGSRGKRGDREKSGRRRGKRQWAFGGTVEHLLLTVASPSRPGMAHSCSLRQDAGTPCQGLIVIKAVGLLEALQSSGCLLRLLSALALQPNQIGLFISQKWTESCRNVSLTCFSKNK